MIKSRYLFNGDFYKKKDNTIHLESNSVFQHKKSFNIDIRQIFYNINWCMTK